MKIRRTWDKVRLPGFLSGRCGTSERGRRDRGGLPLNFPRACGAAFVVLSALLPGSPVQARDIRFPADLKIITDVTKPPYNCDNTGVKDCTEALVRAMDDLVRPARDGQRALVAKMSLLPPVDYTDPSSVENRIVDGKVRVIFPAELAPAKILYFPKGTYKVSNTVTYTIDDLQNSLGIELNRQIIIRGENEKETVIKLADNCPGFQKGANRPVVSYMLKELSNVAMANIFENITIDVGSGNAGAAGLRFYGNNMAAVRNVTIKSGDPEKRGAVGLLLDKNNISGVLIKNLTVDGFDYGVQILPNRIACVLEHIFLTDQKTAGILVDNLLVSIRGLVSKNSVPALVVAGISAQVTLIDSNLQRTSPAESDAAVPAIDFLHGVLFARNVDTPGYSPAVGQYGKEILPAGHIGEYSSHGVFTMFKNPDDKSLNLPVEETPDIPWENDMSKWVSVNRYGAKGDGMTDDTAAIQKAMDSGIPNIYFQPGKYLIDNRITVPGTVNRINFMFADLAAGKSLQAMADRGTFQITGDATTPLIFEDLFAFEACKGQQYLIEQASTRTLVVSDVHVQTGALYTNSVPGGKVFFENVACTDQFPPNPNCFTFKGQKVWARQFNPERGNPQVLNDGGTLWVLGVKIESGGVGFATKNNGFTEVLGGTTNIGKDIISLNDNSNVSIVIGSSGWKPGNIPVLTEIRDGAKKSLERENMVRRVCLQDRKNNYTEQFFLPLYVGKHTGTADTR